MRVRSKQRVWHARGHGTNLHTGAYPTRQHSRSQLRHATPPAPAPATCPHQHVTRLVRALGARLTSLQLGNSDSGDGSRLTDAAARAIAARCPRLTVLRLDSVTGMTGAALEALARGLPGCGSCTSRATTGLAVSAPGWRPSIKGRQAWDSMASYVMGGVSDWRAEAGAGQPAGRVRQGTRGGALGAVADAPRVEVAKHRASWARARAPCPPPSPPPTHPPANPVSHPRITPPTHPPAHLPTRRDQEQGPGAAAQEPSSAARPDRAPHHRQQVGSGPPAQPGTLSAPRSAGAAAPYEETPPLLLRCSFGPAALSSGAASELCARAAALRAGCIHSPLACAPWRPFSSRHPRSPTRLTHRPSAPTPHTAGCAVSTAARSHPCAAPAPT